MIIVLEPGTPDDQIQEVMQGLEEEGLQGRVLHTGRKPVIHLLSGPTRSARATLKLKQVQALVPTSGPRVRRYGRRFYPHHFIGWCVKGLLISALLVLLAGYFPPGLGDEINLSEAPGEVDTPWYLRAFTAFLAYAPGAAGWSILGLVVLIAFCVPLLDRSRGDGLRGRLPVLALGTLALLFLAYLSVLGANG